MSPLVSVIVPTYNYGHLIGATLENLLTQSYENIEIIIIDDGSADNTKELVLNLQKQDKRIRYFYQENQGVSAVKNAGLSLASGQYIQFLDADDLISKNKIKNAVAFIDSKQHLGAGLVFSRATFFKDGSNEFFQKYPEKFILKESLGNEALIKKFLEHNIFVISAPLFDRRLIGKAGMFDLSLKSNEDWDFWLRIALSGCLFYFDDSADSLTYIRVHSNGMMQNVSKMAFSERVFREKIENILTTGKTGFANSKSLLHINRTRAAFLEIRFFSFWSGWGKAVKECFFYPIAFFFIIYMALYNTAGRVRSFLKRKY